MKARIRRVGAAAGALAIAGALTASPAGAATPEVFVGSAAGRALNIDILGTKASFGIATAEVDSTLKASAKGIGDLATLATETTATVTGAGRSAKPQACASPTPLNVANAINLGIACSNATAEVLGGLPHAVAKGHVVGLDLSANNLIAALPAAAQLPIGSTLQSVLQPLASTPLSPVSTTVNDLVNSVLKTKTLDVKIGEATSDVLTDAGKVTSIATAEAAVIKLLPTPELAGVASLDPVATISVSSAKASAVYDRKTGVATPSVDPALVTVKLNTVLSNSLGVKEIKVAPGVNQTILAGTPFESDIIVAAGTTQTKADGSVQAIADGVRLHLLKGISGGIKLELAHAEAGVAGKPATVDPAPAQIATPPGLELPRTGGPAALVPMAGLFSLLAAFGLRRVRG